MESKAITSNRTPCLWELTLASDSAKDSFQWLIYLPMESLCSVNEKIKSRVRLNNGILTLWFSKQQGGSIGLTSWENRSPLWWSLSWCFFSSLIGRWDWPPRALERARRPALLPMGGMAGGWRPEGCGVRGTGRPCPCDKCWAWSCCCCEKWDKDIELAPYIWPPRQRKGKRYKKIMKNLAPMKERFILYTYMLKGKEKAIKWRNAILLT